MSTMLAVIAAFSASCWLAMWLTVAPVRPAEPVRSTRRGRPIQATAMATVAAILALALGPAPVLTVLAAVFAGWRWRSLGRRRASFRRQADCLPDAVELLVLAVRAGYTPVAAVRAAASLVAGELRPAFAGVVAAVDRGARFADALSVLVDELGTIAEPLVDALAAAERYGLPLAPVLDRLAAEARSARRRQADAAARELPVRLAAPLVLCTLPSFVLLSIVPLLAGTLLSLDTQP